VDLDPVELNPVYLYLAELSPVKFLGPVKLDCVGLDPVYSYFVESDP